MRKLLVLLPALALLASAAPAEAQRAGAVPRRPNLGAQADTNDAKAYLNLGNDNLRSNNRVAADAFYWAYELDPTSAEALYGRYTALLMSNPRRLIGYWNGDRRIVRSREIVAIDSLLYRAMTINPFLYRRLENELFRAYLFAAVREGDGGIDRLEDDEIEFLIGRYMSRAGPFLRARQAYTEGRHHEALELYDEALRDSRDKSYIRMQRAQIMAHVGADSLAVAEYAKVLEELRKEDERDIVYIYESKALMEYSTGKLYERMGNLDGAREAYGRALTEDLAFYPAHVRMAMLAMARGDTSATVAEMELALQTGAWDPTVGYTYGAMLSQMGRFDEAGTQLGKVIAGSPYYPEPHFALAVTRDQQGNVAGALEAYQAFLARAPRNHARRAAAEQRVRDLGGAAAAGDR